jgi:bacteriorhodopsin
MGAFNSRLRYLLQAFYFDSTEGVDISETALISDSLLLAVAVFVFVMMMIGLLLTMREFSRGQPKRETHEADHELEQMRTAT